MSIIFRPAGPFFTGMLKILNFTNFQDKSQRPHRNLLINKRKWSKPVDIMKAGEGERKEKKRKIDRQTAFCLKTEFFKGQKLLYMLLLSIILSTNSKTVCQNSGRNLCFSVTIKYDQWPTTFQALQQAVGDRGEHDFRFSALIKFNKF